MDCSVDPFDVRAPPCGTDIDNGNGSGSPALVVTPRASLPTIDVGASTTSGPFSIRVAPATPTGPSETRFVGVVYKKPFSGFVPPPPPPLPPIGDADQKSGGDDAANSDSTAFAIAKEEKGLFDDVTSVLFTADSFGDDFLPLGSDVGAMWDSLESHSASTSSTMVMGVATSALTNDVASTSFSFDVPSYENDMHDADEDPFPFRDASQAVHVCM